MQQQAKGLWRVGRCMAICSRFADYTVIEQDGGDDSMDYDIVDMYGQIELLWRNGLTVPEQRATKRWNVATVCSEQVEDVGIEQLGNDDNIYSGTIRL